MPIRFSLACGCAQWAVYAAYRNRVESAFLADELAAAANLTLGGDAGAPVDSPSDPGGSCPGSPGARGGGAAEGVPGDPPEGPLVLGRNGTCELALTASADAPDLAVLGDTPVASLTPGPPSPDNPAGSFGDTLAPGMGSACPEPPFSPHGDSPAPPLVSSAMADLGHLAASAAVVGAASVVAFSAKAAPGGPAASPFLATSAPAACEDPVESSTIPGINPSITAAGLMTLARRTARWSARLAAADMGGVALLSVSPHVAAAPPEPVDDDDENASDGSASDADACWAGYVDGGDRESVSFSAATPAGTSAPDSPTVPLSNTGGGGGAAAVAGALAPAMALEAAAASSAAGGAAPVEGRAAAAVAAAEEGAIGLRRRMSRRGSSRELLDPLSRAAREVRRAQSAAAAAAGAAAAAVVGEDVGVVLADTGAAAALHYTPCATGGH